MIIELFQMIPTFIILLSLCICKRKAKKLKYAKMVAPKSGVKQKQDLQIQENVKSVKAVAPPACPLHKALPMHSNTSHLMKSSIIRRSHQKSVEKTQSTIKKSPQGTEEVTESIKEILEANDREVSSHSTLEQVLPRVRFYERADEIRTKEPVDKQQVEYRTLRLTNQDEDLSTENICLREVRPQDITQCKIEKYNVVGYKLPETLQEYTCRDDDF